MAISAIGLALAVGTTGYGVAQGREQAREARDAARDQENAQKAMVAAQQQEGAQQTQDAANQARQLEQRQRAIASGYQNAAGRTNFTSPLGLPGGASTTRGNLLGL